MNSLERLRLDPAFMANVTAWERLPARPARTAPFPAGLDGRLEQTLRSQGIPALYTHQALAVSAALRGENVVVVTGTASGKTLCYNLPVLQALLSDPEARALYLFPTKALAQDQAAALAGLAGDAVGQWTADHGRQTTDHRKLPVVRRLSSIAGGPSSVVHLYDGDTPTSQRASIRKSARLLLSNPDMLHTGILPHHPRWADFLAGLRYVVLDELHVYRGVFGSHMANVLRRLRRVCAFYGSRPQFLCASATVANPQELAGRLLEAPVTLVPPEADGSPRAEKSVILYNPPLVDPALGLRRSYLLEAQRLAGEFLADGVQTVVFARTRNAVEVLLGYLRDEARQRGLDPASIRGYRGGYLPLERREIERGLRAGEVRGVVATNALELGVDIGQLGAAVVAGYPGAIASLWQQAGRAGRRSEHSAAVLVGSAAPLDQFLMLHPSYLFERPPERALVNPDNLALLLDHLRCALFELPFRAGESFGRFDQAQAVLEAIVEDGEAHFSGGAFRWVGGEYPAGQMSLRSAGADRVVIQAAGEARPVVIGEVERAMAPLRVHAGAVYLHEGRQYLVENLDWENGVAEARPAEVDYFTEASEAVDLEVLEVHESAGERSRHAWGQVLITAQPASYRMVRRYTHETLGYGTIDLPAREFQTTGYWLWLPPELTGELARVGVLLGPNDYGPSWEAQRSAARARDGFHCRQCGAPEPAERQHDVHHVIPFRSFGYIPGLNENYRQANELDNLLSLCRACHRRAEMARGTQTALGGLAHALGNLAPLYLMCDPRDLGSLAEARSRATGAPTITLYDLIPEGLGFAQQLYELRADLLRGAAELVRACPCRDGCPACVGPVGLAELEVKALSLRLAEALAG